MKTSRPRFYRRATYPLIAVTLSLTGCMTAAQQQRADLYADTATCADMGTRYGSHAHTQCMLRQQQRRDDAQLRNLESARISSETARNNLETLRLIRKNRGD